MTADTADSGLPGGAFGATVEALGGRHATMEQIESLAGPDPALGVEGLVAGYGRREVLHGVDLRLGKGQSICVIGPNGAGKSTLLHSICGLTDIRAGRVRVGGRDMPRSSPSARLRDGHIAYVMQDSSVFPDMTVDQNLMLGGYLLPSRAEARAAAERIFDRYPQLAPRRNSPARVLSGGERRLLELGRALIMRPRVLLVDEPSIGLAIRYIDLVFDILRDLQRREGISILMVEQNAAKGLEFADVGYVMVAGQVALVGPGNELLRDPAVGTLFLGR